MDYLSVMFSSLELEFKNLNAPPEVPPDFSQGDFVLFRKLPLELRREIFRHAVDPDYLEVQIDMDPATDCLGVYGPHDCQQEFGDDCSLPTITFKSKYIPHPLLFTCRESRLEYLHSKSADLALPSFQGPRISFNPYKTTLYINNMGNFLDVLEDLGGFNRLCKKFGFKFNGIQKLAVDFRCCIPENAWDADRTHIEKYAVDDYGEEYISDDWVYMKEAEDPDWTTGPKAGVWGQIFEHCFDDLKAIEYVTLSRDERDVPKTGHYEGFEKEVTKAIKDKKDRKKAAEDAAAKAAGVKVAAKKTDGDGATGQDLVFGSHDGRLRTCPPDPVRGHVQEDAPSDYFV